MRRNARGEFCSERDYLHPPVDRINQNLYIIWMVGTAIGMYSAYAIASM